MKAYAMQIMHICPQTGGSNFLVRNLPAALLPVGICQAYQWLKFISELARITLEALRTNSQFVNASEISHKKE